MSSSPASLLIQPASLASSRRRVVEALRSRGVVGIVDAGPPEAGHVACTVAFDDGVALVAMGDGVRHGPTVQELVDDVGGALQALVFAHVEQELVAMRSLPEGTAVDERPAPTPRDRVHVVAATADDLASRTPTVADETGEPAVLVPAGTFTVVVLSGRAAPRWEGMLPVLGLMELEDGMHVGTWWDGAGEQLTMLGRPQWQHTWRHAAEPILDAAHPSGSDVEAVERMQALAGDAVEPMPLPEGMREAFAIDADRWEALATVVRAPWSADTMPAFAAVLGVPPIVADLARDARGASSLAGAVVLEHDPAWRTLGTTPTTATRGRVVTQRSTPAPPPDDGALRGLWRRITGG